MRKRCGQCRELLLCGKTGRLSLGYRKEIYTTVEEISTVNELKDGEISVGQPLLLIKKVEQ
mgnify:CR=1 FL=1